MPHSSTLLITDPCSYNTATGYIYIDNNGNCTYDAGDVGLYNPTANCSVNLSSPPGTGWNGGWLWNSTAPAWYQVWLQESWMVDYTISVPSYYSFIFPTSSCFTGTHTFTTLPQTGVDFPLQCTSNVDLQCGALAPPSARLHSAFYMQPYVSNTGCDSISGQLTLVKDSRVIYDPALSTHPADIVHGDTLIWNYSNLTNLSSGAYWNSFSSDINLTPNSTVTIGDTLCFRVFTNIPSSDINVFNNDYSICLPVVYSFDPNVKEVVPAGTGPAGNISTSEDTLTYTLHFQNTGSAAAYNATITDTLDSHIIPNSLHVLGTSHNMQPAWIAPGVVQFVFGNINLPDSNTNEPASHGSVRFSVALKPGLSMGTQIKNTGYIYFDLNAPVITNTVVNTIAIQARTEQVATNTGVKIYPNPASDRIVVENLNGGDLTVLDLNGQIMIKQIIPNNKTTIDVSQLPGGIYILKTINNSGTNTTKFTKY